ncbi:MAG: LON peptidase substrate-binding domain-containing protein [bacterium]
MQNKKQTITREIPIFPLPNIVFFPKTFLPLHIFEPRYRKMIEDAQSSDNLIGMAVLKEGWEENYHGNPEVHDVACVGKIQNIENIEGGKYNILLYGISRVKILEFVQGAPYRIARVRYLKDSGFDPDGFNENVETERFLKLVRAYLVEMGVKNFDDLIKLHSHSLESVVNQIASALDFATLKKLELLQMDFLEDRYLDLKQLLKTQLAILKVAKKVKVVPDNPSWN